MADRYVADGERRVTAQILRLEQLDEDHRDTRVARNLLATLQQTLAAWVAHRSAIIREIARVERSGPPRR